MHTEKREKRKKREKKEEGPSSSPHLHHVLEN
jgi:hypothetical protein